MRKHPVRRTIGTAFDSETEGIMSGITKTAGHASKLVDSGGKWRDFRVNADTGLVERWTGQWQGPVEPYVYPETFGAVGNGIADDTRAIQAAIDSISQNSRSGGTVFFSRGVYRKTATLDIRSENIRLGAAGKRNCQTILDPTVIDGPGMIYSDHADACIKLVNSESCNGFQLDGITLLGNTSNRGSAGVLFYSDNATKFRRDFSFDESAVAGFECGILVDRASGMHNSWGVLKVTNCSVKDNRWLAKTDNGTQWNGFLFRFNEAGNNGYQVGEGGIYVSAHCAMICDNILEGQRDAVRVSGGYGACRVAGNYFEANVGDYCIYIDGNKGPVDIGPNYYYNVTTTHKAKVYAARAGSITDPVWPDRVYHMGAPITGEDAEEQLDNTATDAYGYIQRARAEHLSPPSYTALTVSKAGLDTAMISPFDGKRIPVRTYTTTGTGLLSVTQTIAGVSGQWVVVEWLLKRGTSDGANPYLTIQPKLVAANVDYKKDLNYYYYKTHIFDDWYLVTAATPLAGTIDRVALSYYCYGINPAGGLVAYTQDPSVYISNNVNDIRPYYPQGEFLKMSAAEFAAMLAASVGPWSVDDIIKKSPATPGDFIAWVCTTAGSPGTWKEFGAIQP